MLKHFGDTSKGFTSYQLRVTVNQKTHPADLQREGPLLCVETVYSSAESWLVLYDQQESRPFADCVAKALIKYWGVSDLCRKIAASTQRSRILFSERSGREEAFLCRFWLHFKENCRRCFSAHGMYLSDL